MKNLVFIISLLAILSYFLTKSYEGFTVYQLNFRSDNLPTWYQGSNINRGYLRCICSSDADCRCINDTQLDMFFPYEDDKLFY